MILCINSFRNSPKKYLFLGLILNLLFINSLYAQQNKNLIDEKSFSATYLEQTEFQTDIRQQETILHIQKTGMYSIQVKSSTGAFISVIDRMAGVLDSSGSVSNYDGRIDIMLSEGEYKIQLLSDIYSQGTIMLDVYSYKELNYSDNSENMDRAQKLSSIPVITDGDFILTELNDLEQQSFWVYIKEDEPLILELLGRNLSGIILWKDGAWLTPVSPSLSTFEPEPGKPMKYIEFYHEFTEGYYLLTCYGGVAEDWSGEQDSFNTEAETEENTKEGNPLYIRYGIPYIGESGMEELTISPFGRDVYKVSNSTNYFQVVRENYEETIVKLNRFSKNSSRFSNNRVSREITNESENSYCTIEYSSGSYEQLLIIQAKPGDTCNLTFFKETSYYQFEHSNTETKTYWVSSIDNIEGRNLIDLSPILYDQETNKILQDNTPVLGPENPYARRINLLSESTLYINIEEAGTYKIVESEEYGAVGKYWFVLFENVLNGTYDAENFQTADESFELTAGLYILSIRPEHSGILHFVIYNESKGFNIITESAKENALANAKLLLEAEPQKSINYFTWPNVVIPRRGRYDDEILIFLNPREEEDSLGLIIRELPIILDNPLPVFLLPGEIVEIPIKIEEVSRLKIGGTDPQIEVRGSINSDTIAMDDFNLYPGEYIVTITNNNPGTELFTVFAEKLELEKIPPPELKPVEEVFTFLTEQESLYEDFDYTELKEFILQVDEPGFYRIETSGRLSMRIDVRTDLTSSLFTESNNGIGRNALIQTYLKPGDYLIRVQTLGASSGRAGIHLNRTPMIDAGILFLDSIARNTVELDNALKFSIDIEEYLEYSIETFGLNKSFSYRMEDSDGWPVYLPIGTGELYTDLYPGTYYFYSLPEPLKTRRLTRIIPNLEYSDPDDLLIVNKFKEAVWQETSEPDVYYFTLSASTLATLFITQDMEARIFIDNKELFYFTGGEDIDIQLEQGEYEIHVRPIEENNYYPYVLTIYSNYLIPGTRKAVDSDTLIVSVSEESIVDIWSTGEFDKKASLWDETGTVLLAENDDMENDWNFRISRRLEPGLYNLKVENAGVDSYTTSIINMEIRNERLIEINSLPFNYNGLLNKDVLTMPFLTDNTPGLLEIKCAADSEISVALYKGDKLIVKTEDLLYIPLDESSSYTLQFWHNENTDIPVKISTEIINELTVIELSDTAEELSLPSILEVVNNTGLSYYFYAENSELLYSDGIDRPCIPLRNFPVNTENESGWIINLNIEEDETLYINPLTLNENKTVTVMLGDIPHSYFINHISDNILLLEIESQGIITGAIVLPDNQYDKENINWDGVYVEQSETLTGIIETGLYQGKLWKVNTDGFEEDAMQRIDITLRAFTRQGQMELSGTEQFTMKLEPGLAYEIELGNRVQELNLLLAKNITAFSVNNKISESIINASSNNLEKTINVSGGKIVIVNRGNIPASFRIQRTGFTEEVAVKITSGNQFENIMEQDGSIIFDIDYGINNPIMYSLNTNGSLDIDSDGYVLCVSGDIVDAALFSNNGNIYNGNTIYYGNNYSEQRPYLIFPSYNGKLEVNYSEGYLKVWIAELSEIDTRFLEPTESIRNSTLYNNIGVLTDNSQKWTLEIDEPGFISIDTNASGFIALLTGNEVLSISAGTSGRKILTYLEPGTYKIITRPFKNSYQAGNIFIDNIEVNSITEDLMYFIGPFEIQAFKFNVTAESRVGIGLNAEADSLICTLYNKDFNLISTGSIIFEDLKPGEYFIVVESIDIPVQYNPIVLGADGSITDIPLDIIEEFE